MSLGVWKCVRVGVLVWVLRVGCIDSLSTTDSGTNTLLWIKECITKELVSVMKSERLKSKRNAI